MMRVRASHRAPRLLVFGFRAGHRTCADSFRRVVPTSTLAAGFLAFLLALGFGGPHFSQLLLNFEGKPRNGEDKSSRVRRFEISSDPGADGIYAIEDEIRVTVAFSRAVEVTGSPELGLRVGSEVKPALYRSGSGTVGLVFSYRVPRGTRTPTE